MPVIEMVEVGDVVEEEGALAAAWEGEPLGEAALGEAAADTMQRHQSECCLYRQLQRLSCRSSYPRSLSRANPAGPSK